MNDETKVALNALLAERNTWARQMADLRDELDTALDLLWEYRRKDGLPTYPTLDAVKRLGGVARDPRDDI